MVALGLGVAVPLAVGVVNGNDHAQSAPGGVDLSEAQVSGRVEVSPEEGTAHVIFQADPGERFKFGKVNVSGNRRVDADEIANATGINKGDSYSPQSIALAQQRAQPQPALVAEQGQRIDVLGQSHLHI